MTATTLRSEVLVSTEIYSTLPRHPARVRECVTAATQAMEAVAAEGRRVLSETPRLIDQRPSDLGFVYLVFEADTAKR